MKNQNTFEALASRLTDSEEQLASIASGKLSAEESSILYSVLWNATEKLYKDVYSLCSDNQTSERTVQVCRKALNGLIERKYVSEKEKALRTKTYTFKTKLARAGRSLNVSSSATKRELTARTVLCRVSTDTLNDLKGYFRATTPRDYINLEKLSVASSISGDSYNIFTNIALRVSREKSRITFKTLISEYGVECCKLRGLSDVKIDSADVINFTNSVVSYLFKKAV